MEEEKKTEKRASGKELVQSLRRKRLRKYALTALVLVIAVSTIVGLSIENKDAKIADGQGNVIIGTGEDVYEKAQEEKAEMAEGDKTDADAKDKDGKKAEKDAKAEKPKTAAELKFSEEEKEKLTAEEIKVDNSDDFTASNAGNVSLKPKDPKPVTVTLEIRCDTLSQDMDRLENPAIKDYIPEDGTILAKTTYKGTTDNLTRSIRFAGTMTFSLSSATRRFMLPTISRASTIFMNLTAARKAAGCTRSTNGSRTTAVPPTTCMTVIPLSGAIPVKVWEQMSGQTNGWDNREQ